jgi:hypothetical protein
LLISMLPFFQLSPDIIFFSFVCIRSFLASGGMLFKSSFLPLFGDVLHCEPLQVDVDSALSSIDLWNFNQVIVVCCAGLFGHFLALLVTVHSLQISSLHLRNPM